MISQDNTGSREIGPLVDYRQRVPSEVIDRENVKVYEGPLYHPNATLIQKLRHPDYYINQSLFAFASDNPPRGIEIEGMVPRRATTDMNRGYVLMDLAEPLVIGERDNLLAYPQINYKGTGITKRNLAKLLTPTILSRGDPKKYGGSTESKTPFGLLGNDSIKEELELSTILRENGVRTSQVLAVIPLKQEAFRQWLEAQSKKSMNTYDPLQALRVVAANGAEPAMLVRAGSFRYWDVVNAPKEGRYTREAILRITARSYIAEILHKGKEVFMQQYGLKIPDLQSALEAISDGTATSEDLKKILQLETQLAAFNFGRSQYVSNTIYGGRLKVDTPSNLQNLGLGGISHDLESKLKESGAPVDQEQLEEFYSVQWETMVLPNLYKMCFPHVTENELDEMKEKDAPLIRQNIHDGLTQGFHPRQELSSYSNKRKNPGRIITLLKQINFLKREKQREKG